MYQHSHFIDYIDTFFYNNIFFPCCEKIPMKSFVYRHYRMISKHWRGCWLYSHQHHFNAI